MRQRLALGLAAALLVASTTAGVQTAAAASTATGATTLELQDGPVAGGASGGGGTAATDTAASGPSATDAGPGSTASGAGAASDLPAPSLADGPTGPVPTLAYYYIWFNPTSWSRAKIDYPLLGRYSSDDATIMERHIRWAKAAGIRGFLVSWKSTPVLDARLATLRGVAAAEGFKLGIVYQGLDFHRHPLPVDTVQHDLAQLAERYGDDPVFRIFDRPLVVWSGTWQFSTDEIIQATAGVRSRLLVLASAKNVKDYERVHGAVDGDAYYWSSVDPRTNTRYRDKLVAMSAAVHARGGLWIAPAAPGFDARLIGGKEVVDRRDGQTLREEMAAAAASSPDAIGVISWNEFSENTYIEPSTGLGDTALRTLASILHAKAPDVGNFDSDGATTSSQDGVAYGLPLLIGFAFALPIAVLLIRRVLRRQRRQRAPDDGGRPAA